MVCGREEEGGGRRGGLTAGRASYGGQGQVLSKARAPVSMGGLPVSPLMRVVMSRMLIHWVRPPLPGAMSQRELKKGWPGLVSKRRLGATKLVTSRMSSLFVLLPPSLTLE